MTEYCVNCGFQLTPSNMSKAKRLPVDWKLPDEWAEWTRRERPDVNPLVESPKFADYWRAKAGKDAAKLDWFGTWRNWIRSAKATPGFQTTLPARQQHQSQGPRLTEAQREQNKRRLAEMMSGFAESAAGPDTSMSADGTGAMPAAGATR